MGCQERDSCQASLETTFKVQLCPTVASTHVPLPPRIACEDVNGHNVRFCVAVLSSLRGRDLHAPQVIIDSQPSGKQGWTVNAAYCLVGIAVFMYIILLMHIICAIT